uniref:hypothetical protein n=1 Tax=Thaumasiovibrio occultus TaxID=1891184 RepID=UPI000B353F7A|nr:hypothetical protein [Thaumasiovibrio occultus]
MKVILAIVFGAAIGVGGHFFWIHNQVTPVTSDATALKLAFEHSQLVLSESQNSCSDNATPFTVGDALASVLELSELYDVNRLDYGCGYGVCTVSVSSCPPWQDSECGQRFLRIDVTPEFEPTSFTCFDMP